MWRAKPLSSIELRHLRYFLAAAEHGSFRKAGIALAVQESAISRRIRDLEDRLGASLCHRHNGGVKLTMAGRNFLDQTRVAMKHLGDGVTDVGAIDRSESGHLRVGIFSSLSSGFLHELFRAYDVDLKSVRIDFSDGNPTEHIAAVRMHQIDVASSRARRSTPVAKRLICGPSRSSRSCRPPITWQTVRRWSGAT